MLDEKRIKKLFERLNKELKRKSETGEIGIVGGAVMCLVYRSRVATRDIDAIFAPSKIIREIAAKIAEEEGLPPDWINDAAKAFIRPGFRQEEVLNLSNLRIWAPEPRYILAMKCISARVDTSDGDDIRFLVKHLSLKGPNEIFEIIEGFYPKNKIEPKTQFFIEELFEDQ